MKLLRSASLFKTVAAVSVSFALGVSQPALAANQQLDFVPGDTLFYLGTGKPVPVEDFFAMVPGFFDAEALEKILPEMPGDGKDEELLKKIGEFFKDPGKFTTEWGLGDELQFSAYTVGVLPVFRIAGDPEKFSSALTKIEAEGNKKHKIDRITHKGVEVRITPFDQKEEKKTEVNTPDKAEIEKAESSVSALKEESDMAAEALDAANARLDVAKGSNDAAGIAAAANAIAEAAGKMSEISARREKAESELARLNQLVTDTEKLVKAGGKSGAGLIVAANEGDLIFAVSSNAYDPELLDQLLGIEAPDKSLSATGKLKKIRKDWNYGDEMAMYFDFQLVADALTGGDSLAAKQIKTLSAADNKLQRELQLFSAEPCKSELRQMSANWPMMVSGNRRFEVNDNQIGYDSHFAMVLEHEALRDTLQLLRGVVPMSQSNSEAVMSFGIGLNVDTTPQLAAQVTEIIGAVDFQCEPLQSLNKMRETDISALSMGAMMFSGMARGVKGFSVNVYDAEVDVEASIPVENVDAAIAVAAEDPAMLVQTLQMLPQMGVLADIPLDGTAVSLNQLLPVPIPDGVEVFAAVKDKSIVFYSGEQAADFANRLSGSGDEGFIVSSFNTRKLVTKLKDVADQMPEELKKEEDVDAVLELMKSYPLGNIMYQLDFTDRGIELETFSDIERLAR